MGNTEIAKKVIMHDPYLDSVGGGERYFLTVATLLAKNNYQVDIFWTGDNNFLNKATQLFGLDLSNINIVNKDFNNLNIIQKFIIMRKYDLSFIINDGSIPFLFSKKNYIHIQVPFNLPKQKNIITRVKLLFIKKIICNSIFTKKWTTLSYNTSNIEVLYPPINTLFFNKKQSKKKQILSVARFSDKLNSKRQDILIKAFRKFYKNNTEYKLILAGSSHGKNTYLDYLKKISKNLPICFEVNPDISKLRDLYAQSKFFWHATGYNINENVNPEKTEHFGMVLVEAASAGCTVMAVSKGGANEIMCYAKNVFLYNNINTLVKLTEQNINSKTINTNNLSIFSLTNFEKNLLNILNK